MMKSLKKISKDWRGNSLYRNMLKRILFVLLPALCFGQKQQFIYQYDKVGAEENSKELMLLDVYPDRSYYYSYAEYQEDSLLQASKKNYPAEVGAISTFMKDFVQKEKEPEQVFLYTKVENDYYKIKDNRKIQWKTQDSLGNLLGFKTQKAVADFAGRKWVAWFTTDIPISDGPYKFWGLPGLILKIEDTEKLHHIELVGIKNDFQEFRLPKQRYISISEAKYRDLLKKYTDNPFWSLQQKGVDVNQINKVFVDGKQVDTQEFLKKGKIGYKIPENPLELE